MMCFTVLKYSRFSLSHASMLSAWFEMDDSMVSFAISVMRFFDSVAAMTTSARTVRTTTGMMKVSSLELIFLVFFSMFLSPAKTA